MIKKQRKQKQSKFTKEDWIELLEFWPLSIVVPGCIIAILVGVWMGV